MIGQAKNATNPARFEVERTDLQRTQKLLTAGGILGAFAASSCCVLPLALFGLGVGGAWVSHLTRLAPYQPCFIAATAGCLGFGYWLRYRARKRGCAEGSACARPLSYPGITIGLVFATVLVVGALALDFLAPLFL